MKATISGGFRLVHDFIYMLIDLPMITLKNYVQGETKKKHCTYMELCTACLRCDRNTCTMERKLLFCEHATCLSCTMQ